MKKVGGANMDIDFTFQGDVSWKQQECPWNESEGVNTHKCAIKNTSICKYFEGMEKLDTVLCSYNEGERK